MYILFDIGGTKMRIAASPEGKTFGDPVIIETPEKFSDGIQEFERLSKKLAGGEKIQAIAGGIAGPLDKQKQGLINSPNLSGWIGRPLVKTLAKKLDAPVYLENDTAIVGLGEAVAGAGKNQRIVAYVTISTGVNGARIVNNAIDTNEYGFEIGHQFIASPRDPHAHACGACDIPGHLEGFVSGSALEKRFGKKAWEITDETIWHDVAVWLSYGLVNTAVYWSPDVIVLGGSMMKSPGIPFDTVLSEYNKNLTIFPEKPKLAKATLGDIGGLHGALAFMKQKHAR